MDVDGEDEEEKQGEEDEEGEEQLGRGALGTKAQRTAALEHAMEAG